MTDNSKLLKYLIPIVFAVTLLVTFVAWISTPGENISLTEGNPVKYTLDWHDADNDELITSTSVSIAPGQTKAYILHTDDFLPVNTLLYFYDPGLDISCYEKGRLIYHSENKLTFGSETGAIWRKVYFTEEHDGLKIVLFFTNNRSTTIKIDFNQICLGSSGDMLSQVVNEAALGLLEALLCLITGIAISLMALFLFRTGYSDYGKIILSIGIACICISIWIFSDGQIMQLSSSNGSLRYSLAYLSFMLVPVFFGHYLAETFKEQFKLPKIIVVIYEIACSVVFILLLLRLTSISSWLLIPQSAILLEMVLAILYACKEVLKDKNKTNIGMLIAFTLMGIFSFFGFKLYYSARQSSVSSHIGLGFLVFIIVISSTELKKIIVQYRTQQKVRNYNDMASVDPVTGGNSRFAAVQWMGKHDFHSCNATWMIQMFLPNFSAVNALKGWDDGDKILRDIYSLVQSYLKPDDMLCRLDDTFVLMLPDPTNIDKLCKNLIGTVQEYMRTNYKEIVLTPEFTGVWMDEYATIEQLLEKSRICYGNNHADYHSEFHIYYFTAECNRAERLRLELETEITNALVNDEFVVFYQPKVNPLTGKVLGAEALVRWMSPTRGMVSPAEFIPVIESTGQIADVDFFVFRKVCEYLVKRKKEGLEPLTISVNVSKKDIENPNFFNDYLNVIKELDVPTNCLEFEFTESTAFDNMGSIDSVMEKIHSIGSHVAMDDFGSGYSNLAALGKLNFDVVKLDKSLFDGGFPFVASDSTLIEGLISMFRSMGISIVCEGIEYENARDALRDLGVDLIQGFYYSKPLPEDNFTEFANSRH